MSSTGDFWRTDCSCSGTEVSLDVENLDLKLPKSGVSTVGCTFDAAGNVTGKLVVCVEGDDAGLLATRLVAILFDGTFIADYSGAWGECPIAETCGPAPIAAKYWQRNLAFAEGEGDVPLDLLEYLGDGAQAAYSGSIYVKGCYDVRVTMYQLDGGSCDCPSTEATTVVPRQIVVGPNQQIEVGRAWISQIQVEVLDDNGVPVPRDAELESCVEYLACCDQLCSPVLIPAGSGV